MTRAKPALNTPPIRRVTLINTHPTTMADETPRDFHHPYTPYDIQLQFMNALYNAIEDGCVGIFESPTGTVSLFDPTSWLRVASDLEVIVE